MGPYLIDRIGVSFHDHIQCGVNDADVREVWSVRTSGVGGGDRNVVGIWQVRDAPYGRSAKVVVPYGRILGITHGDATPVGMEGIVVYFVVLDERLARGGHAAYLLEAYAGPTVVDHEVVVYPETVRVTVRVVAEVVAPQAVALRIVNVGVLDLDLVTRLHTRSDKA